ncbi:alpha/beta hydrolase family protein [Lacticaseibacillus absianus]|uniref:alpha/beta hydrolase family protein n=1 Tax=Lacticaseibacillus absianus TaxID=2729623 RepID=UPI0015CAC06A|nr:prolyl oligopeptidase family serine peptidase [Lacticaseibacillus absianus]
MDTRLYYDTTRRDRPLATALWWPDPRVWPAPHPLILLSHGTGGDRFGQAWLATALCAAGYAVAAPDHDGNSTTTARPAGFVRYWDRPLDLSVLLDHLLAEFGPRLDAQRIGAAGFSFGGYTVLALAGAAADWGQLLAAARTPVGAREFTIPELGDLRPLLTEIDPATIPADLQDPRIKAVAALAPAMGLAFTAPRQLAAVTVPTLIIGATHDAVAPVATNARHYHALLPRATYVELAAGHYTFLPVRSGPVPYFVDPAGVSREAVHQAVAVRVVAFFDQSLR